MNNNGNRTGRTEGTYETHRTDHYRTGDQYRGGDRTDAYRRDRTDKTRTDYKTHPKPRVPLWPLLALGAVTGLLLFRWFQKPTTQRQTAMGRYQMQKPEDRKPANGKSMNGTQITADKQPTARNGMAPAAATGAAAARAEMPQQGQTVELAYTAYRYDESKPEHKGAKIAGSGEQGETVEYTVGNGAMGQAFDQAVQRMTEGQKETVEVPASQSSPEIQKQVPADSKVVYEIELVSID